MPDRTPKPDATPPVSVTVGVPASGPGNVERRADGQAPVNAQPTTQVIVPASASEPGGLFRHVPSEYRGWVQLGFAGVVVGMAVIWFQDGRTQNRELMAEFRSRNAEEREIARARETQQDRRHESQMAKIDALVTKIDAAIERMSGVGAEVRLSRAGIDRIGSDLADALSRLLAELKRLAPAPRKPKESGTDLPGFLNPILWLADHAPPKVMPGVGAGIAPGPRPCETQSQEDLR